MIQSIIIGAITVIAGYLFAWIISLSNKSSNLPKIIRLLGLIIGIIIAIGGSLYASIRFVGAGERGVLLRWGAVQNNILDEGFHIVNPISDSVINVNIKVQKDEITTEAASNDLQIITTTIATNYHLDPSQVNNIYKNIGLNYLDTVITPSVEESVKAVTAKFTATELLTKRPDVKLEINENIKNRLIKYNIIIDDVSITNLEFSEEFNQAIEKKQVSQQDAERAEYLRQKAEIEKQTKILEAQGEAESQRLQTTTLTPEVLKKLEIEKDLQAIYQWDGKLPQYIGGNTMPFINLSNQ